MKITLTGSLGNISKPLAEILIRAGHQVTVISSNAGKKAAIEALGATAAIGSISDTAFLINAFAGADAVYTMVPPNFGVDNYRQYMVDTGKNYVAAIKAAGTKRVLNLSSIGAHIPEGTGPISGLYDVEHLLNALDGVAVKHLRAGFFYINFLHDINLIKNAGIMGSNFSAASRLLMVHPNDIADAAAKELQGSFTGKSYGYVISDDRKVAEVAAILGTAVGKPGLPWVQFTDEEYYSGMTKAGLPAVIAGPYVDMGRSVNSGILWEDYNEQKQTVSGKTKLEDFAKEFAAVYNQ